MLGSITRSGPGFGSPIWNPYGGSSIIEPTGIASLEAFGSTMVRVGILAIEPAGIVSLEAVGAPIIRNLWVLEPTGISSEEVVSNVIITRLVRSLFAQDLENDLHNTFFETAPEFADSASYIYVDGLTETYYGIFDSEYTPVDIEAGAQYMSTSPAFWVATSKLKQRMKVGDKMIIKGIRFKIVSDEPDGTGLTVLVLQREDY